jgi:hypothetical protein
VVCALDLDGAGAPGTGEPARVIVVTSGKGGVGKTTSTANIGSACPTLSQSPVVVPVAVFCVIAPPLHAWSSNTHAALPCVSLTHACTCY